MMKEVMEVMIRIMGRGMVGSEMMRVKVMMMMMIMVMKEGECVCTGKGL